MRFVAVALVMMATAAEAGEPTARELLQNCTNASSQAARWHCAGFIEGVIRGLSMATNNGLMMRSFCPSPKMTSREIVDVVVDVMKRVPRDSLDSEPEMFVHATLVTGFPCVTKEYRAK